MSNAIAIHGKQAEIRPSFYVKKIDDTVTRIVRRYIPHSKLASMSKEEKDKLDRVTGAQGGFINEEVIEDGGFMVIIPTKHSTSIRIRDLSELKAYGFDVDPELIDMNSLETVGSVPASAAASFATGGK